MKIISVAANNFRTLASFDHTSKRGYCPISGANNAGKSCVIKILEHFLSDNDRAFYYAPHHQISFEKDRTQWIYSDFMDMSLCLEIDRDEDSETFFFLDKFAPTPATGQCVTLKAEQRFEAEKPVQTRTWIEEEELDAKTSAEVIKKLRTSANIVVHNSTNSNRSRYYFDESLIELAETQIDQKDKKAIKDAEIRLRSKITQAAKKQKEYLSSLMGRLNDEYEINLTTVEGAGRSAFPLSVSLQDRQVQVPLQASGSGTKNRTEILMSLMEAARTKSAASQENRTTPVVILEEPESFLHPFAQAEFGKMLSLLSDELGIQIIATTHSPYMLNHRRPEANVLLQRRIDKKRLLETCVVDTLGDNWMAPFAEILGIIPPEFDAWRSIIGSESELTILVEGETDKRYFEFFRDEYPTIYNISADVEIVPYGGIDALRNVAMLRFVRRRFKRMFVTFDLDGQEAAVKCSIPDDHISPRRSALFMARSVLRDLRDGRRSC